MKPPVLLDVLLGPEDEKPVELKGPARHNWEKKWVI